jgi:hypothetical protein
METINCWLNQTIHKIKYYMEENMKRTLMCIMSIIIITAGLAFIVLTTISANADGGDTTAVLWNTNLIVNGNAESGTGSTDGYAGGVPIPGWTLDGNILALCYGIGDDWLDLSDPGPTDRGSNYFAGGQNNPSSSATQVIAITAPIEISEIDLGKVMYTLSGHFGGWDGQDDHAVITATFKNISNNTLGTASIGNVLSADRNSNTGLLFRTNSGKVPSGTRSITLQLQLTRVTAIYTNLYNDGYADNLSLILSETVDNFLPVLIQP